MNASQVFLISFFTSIVTAGGTVYGVQRLHLLDPPAPAVQKTQVPNLQGLVELDAQRNLQASGLVMMIGQRKAVADAKPGTVVDQMPLPGQPADKGAAVTVTLAAELPKVPAVLKETLEQAQFKLKQAGYDVTVGEPLSHAEIPAGQVAMQVPSGGESLASGKEVTIRVSSGPTPLEVPKVTGLNLASAKKKLTDAGLKLGNVGYVHDEDLWEDAIVTQKPPAEEKVAPGTAVDIVVNR